MNTVKLIALSALSLALFACGDEAPTAQPAGSTSAAKAKPAASAQKSAAVATTATATATAAADADDLPTVADFEDEADSQIDSANYEAELSSLEKELAEDK